MLELLQQGRSTALRRTATIRPHGDQNNRIRRQQSTHPMQHQNRRHPVLLLQALRHGRDLTFAKTWTMLQLKRLKRPAIHADRTNPTDEDRLGRGISSPGGELVPWIKGFRTHLNTTIGHALTTREWRKKRQFVSRLQELIGTDQLLIDRNADPF